MEVPNPFASPRPPGRFRRWLEAVKLRLGGGPSARQLYPEAAGVGLSVPLQAELDKRCPGLVASWELAPLALWSGVTRGERHAQVNAAVEQRAFLLSLSDEGVGYLEGAFADLADVAGPICEWFADPRPSGEEMHERHPFLDLEPYGRAFERGEAIEFLWQGFLEGEDEWLGPLIEAAAAEPRLRQLRPFTSMGRLCFSRWVNYPFSQDLPYALAHAPPYAPQDDGTFRVFRANELPVYLSGTDPGAFAADAKSAVELLVAMLPEPLEVTYRRPADWKEPW